MLNSFFICLLAAQAGPITATREVDEHPESIVVIAPNREGSVLVTASAKGEIHAWSPKNDALLWKATGEELPPVELDVGEETLAYVQQVPVVTFLSLKDGSTLGALGCPPPFMDQIATTLACDPEGRWAWVGFGNGVALRLNPKDINGWSTRPQQNDGILCFAQDAKAKWLAIGGADHTIRFLNPVSSSIDEKKVLKGHTAAVTALAFDSKGSKIVAGDRSGELHVWNVSSGKSTCHWKAHKDAVLHIAVHPSGDWLATTGSDGSIELWTLDKGERIATPRATNPAPAVGLAFLNKGSLLAAAGGSKTVTLWELALK